MIKLLLLSLLFSFAPGDTLTLGHEPSSLGTAAHQIVIEDRNRTISVEDILEESYEANYFKERSGPTHSSFWIKVALKNSSDKTLHLAFQNSRAGTDQIDVYIYKQKQLLQTHTLGDLRDQALREHLSPKSVFFLDLAAGEEYLIISRFESLGPMNLSWQIYDKKSFSAKSSLEFLFNGLFAGVLIALIIYNLMLFKTLKEFSFLLYVLLTSSMLWIQYTYSGMFYFLDLGINRTFLSLSAWFVPFLYSVLFIQFAIAFFRIAEKNRLLYYVFSAMSAIGLLLFVLSFYLFVDGSFAIYTPFSYLYFYLTLLAIFSYAVYAVIRGYPFALYFFLGEGVYLSTFVYSILVVSGSLSMSSGLQFLVPSAMMLEVIAFSVALSKKVKLLKQTNELNEALLVEESKFSAIGKGIGNVAHQWKRPLSQMNTHLLYLQGLYYTGNEEKLLGEFGPNIEKIGQIMKYMKGSIEELHDFYSDVDANVTFNIRKQIDLAVILQNDKLILNNIAVRVVCDEDLQLSGAKHGFANILMILLDNSIDQFEKIKKEGAKIDIEVVPTQTHCEIRFRDNAGGIRVQPIGRVFEMHFSTKGKEGCGLGLPLAKQLSENALQGEMAVINGAEGAEFTIRAPLAARNGG